MKTRLFIVSAFLVSMALLALLVLGEGWPAVAQSQQAAACNDSFEFFDQWGSTGSGPGQFQAPVAVAVDRDGKVHVTDRDNRRIQKFDPQGNYLLEYGNEDGRYMINPNGVEVGPNGFMYIADTGQHRILYYSALGDFIGGWKDGDGSEWRMLNPWGVAGWEYSGTKNVYVVDKNACQILRFHSNGQFIDDWGHCDSAPYLPSAPQDVATYPTYNSPPNFLYVADTGGNRVMQFDYRLNWLKNWGTAGSGDGEFNEPSSVATDTNGCDYVADTTNHRVQVFDDQGGFIAKFGSQGSEPGQFEGPRGVAVDGDGCVYVADTGNDRIQVFCPQSPLPTPTPPSPTSTPGPTPTPGPTATSSPTPTSTPPPNVDLQVGRIEVVQAVQTITDSISLAANKPTLVRVWISLGGFDAPPSVCCVGGELEVKNGDGVIWHLTPENPGGRIKAFRDPDSNILDHSLNFKLPQEALHGNILLTARINQDQAVPEADYTNNERTENVIFEGSQSLHIVWVPVKYRGQFPDWDQIINGATLLRKLYPIAYSGLRYIGNGGPPIDIGFCRMEVGYCRGQLKKELRSQLKSYPYPPGTIMFGWLPHLEHLYYIGGEAIAPTGQELLERTWAQTAFGTTHSENAGLHMAHEIGHLMGLCHTEDIETDYCSGNLGYPPFDKQRAPYERIQATGVDALTYEIKPSWKYSMMLQHTPDSERAQDRWISPISYQRLFEMLQPQATVNLLQSPEPVLLIRGIISADGNAEVSPAFALDAQPDPVDSDPTKPYSLELLDAGGQVQLTHYFDVVFLSGVEYEAFVFAFALSSVGDLPASIRLWKEGQLLAERTAGAAPPSVTLGAPNGGETWESDTKQTVTWAASDSDGDPLTYALFYSPDDGATWRPLMMTITDTQYIIDPSYVPGSDQARIRVLATDGLHTSADESDGTFTVETKAPIVGISTPTDGATIPLGATIDLTGWGYDPDDGDLSDTGLTWYGPNDEVLGHGSWVQISPTWEPGHYTLRLVATDS
jgi:sugar lactone lactonase YvrE